MQNLKNKIVLITGASSGIGYACAEQFAAQGAHLILSARRTERLQALANKLSESHAVRALTLPLNIQDKVQVQTAFKNLAAEWQDIDILINNAGLALGTTTMQDANPDDWDVMIDTNIKGLLYVTRAVLPTMVSRNQGHIVNLGSIAGHECYPGGNIYCATKHAVKAISQSLRLDLLGKAIRVTNISPGAVETEFSEVRWNDKARAKAFYEDFTPLSADDIADSIIFATSRPSHLNIAEMVLMPTAQASANHLFRQ